MVARGLGTGGEGHGVIIVLAGATFSGGRDRAGVLRQHHEAISDRVGHGAVQVEEVAGGGEAKRLVQCLGAHAEHGRDVGVHLGGLVGAGAVVRGLGRRLLTVRRGGSHDEQEGGEGESKESAVAEMSASGTSTQCQNCSNAWPTSGRTQLRTDTEAEVL